MYIDNEQAHKWIEDMEKAISSLDTPDMRAGAWGVLNDISELFRQAIAKEWKYVSEVEPPKDVPLDVCYTINPYSAQRYTIGMYSIDGWHITKDDNGPYRVLKWRLNG